MGLARSICSAAFHSSMRPSRPVKVEPSTFWNSSVMRWKTGGIAATRPPVTTTPASSHHLLLCESASPTATAAIARNPPRENDSSIAGPAMTRKMALPARA